MHVRITHTCRLLANYNLMSNDLIIRKEVYPNPRGSIHSMPRGSDCKLLSPFFAIAAVLTSIFWVTGTARVSLISRTLRPSCKNKLDLNILSYFSVNTI